MFRLIFLREVLSDVNLRCDAGMAAAPYSRLLKRCCN